MQTILLLLAFTQSYASENFEALLGAEPSSPAPEAAAAPEAETPAHPAIPERDYVPQRDYVPRRFSPLGFWLCARRNRPVDIAVRQRGGFTETQILRKDEPINRVFEPLVLEHVPTIHGKALKKGQCNQAEVVPGVEYELNPAKTHTKTKDFQDVEIDIDITVTPTEDYTNHILEFTLANADITSTVAAVVNDEISAKVNSMDALELENGNELRQFIKSREFLDNVNNHEQMKHFCLKVIGVRGDKDLHGNIIKFSEAYVDARAKFVSLQKQIETQAVQQKLNMQKQKDHDLIEAEKIAKIRERNLQEENGKADVNAIQRQEEEKDVELKDRLAQKQRDTQIKMSKESIEAEIFDPETAKKLSLERTKATRFPELRTYVTGTDANNILLTPESG